MKCEFCDFARECKDPSCLGGGCDIDGTDDFGCGFSEEDEAGYLEEDYEIAPTDHKHWTYWK